MRIFENLKEMYKEVEREIKHNGIISQSTSVQDKDTRLDERYKMKELIAYSYVVKDTSDRDEWLKSVGKNLEWAKADFKERITPNTNPGEAYKLRGDVWGEFIHDGRFAYTYSERIAKRVDDIISLLKNKKNSRQAVLTVYHPDLDDSKRGGTARVPCSMFYQFVERNGRLDVIYVMRSNDFIEHMPYDVWHAAQLRDYIAEQIGAEPGDLIHFASSLHVYYKDNKEIF